jgi:hypothetical protein
MALGQGWYGLDGVLVLIGSLGRVRRKTDIQEHARTDKTDYVVSWLGRLHGLC